MQKLPILSVLFILTLCVQIKVALGTGLPEFVRLKELDLPVPYCEGILKFDGASPFVEIENKLPGVSKYNDLVRLYSRKNYAGLEKEIGSFRNEFETSPLNEAVDFLELQAELEQIESTDAEAIKNAEAKFRSLIILFPRSSLAPALHSSLAAIFLKTGAFPKALGLFQLAYQEYPFHETACSNLLGATEANYQLGNLDDAETGFKMVEQKCQTLRILVGAKVRLIDIRRQRGEKLKDLEKAYEKLNEDYPSFITRYQPEMLFNLGEIRYRTEKFSSSEFFFNEFQRNMGRAHPCHVSLLKRSADISEKTQKKLSVVLGNYLAVYEKFPKTDLGRFSRIHALLLEFGELSQSERDRRTSVIEDELSKIEQIPIRNLGNVEFGVALLDVEILKGLETLDLQRKKDTSFLKQDLEQYVRKKILTKSEVFSEHSQDNGESEQDPQVIESLEASYKNWFVGTGDERKLRLVYSKVIHSQFLSLLKRNKLKKSLGKLEQWASSALFNPEEIDSAMKLSLSSQLSRWWLLQPQKIRVSTAKTFLEKSEVLGPLLKPEGEALWMQAYLESENLGELEHLANEMAKKRNLASVFKGPQSAAVSPLALVMAKAFRYTKNYKASALMLNQVKEAELMDLKIPEQMKTDISLGQTKEAVELGLRSVDSKKETFSRSVLDLCQEAVVSGKKWSLAKQVLDAAEKIKLNERELVPFLTLAGRAFLEMKDCKKSKENYLKAFQINPDLTNKAESRFNLGRCLYQLKEVEAAKKEWTEVVALNDEFWSPLAGNELKILESK